jgi:t-SNARE complex subunit (syntaxin)
MSQPTEETPMNKKDQQLNQLYGATKKIKGIAQNINGEVNSQMPMIDNFNNKIVDTHGNMIVKDRQLNALLNENKNSCNSGLYFIVIVVELLAIIVVIVSWF